MNTAITSEVTPETAGKIKKRQRTRAGIRRIETPAWYTYASNALTIREAFEAGDTEKLAERIEMYADSCECLPYAWQRFERWNIWPLLLGYATAAYDLLTADTGAEPTGQYGCYKCGGPVTEPGAICGNHRLKLGGR